MLSTFDLNLTLNFDLNIVARVPKKITDLFFLF